MFFAGAFVRSDSQLSQPEIDKAREARTTLDPNAPTDPDALAAAQKMSEVEITTTLPGPMAAAIAASALLTNDNARAVQAGKIAVDKIPDDPRVHLNYAIALHRTNANDNAGLVQNELKNALNIVNRKINVAVTEDIYNSIIYFYLYVDPPEGFTKAIQFGEEFLQRAKPTRRSIWVNLACAYGQKYKESLSTAPAQEDLDVVKKKALNAIQEALKLDPDSARRFRELATGSDNPIDNDLMPFANDPDFKRLVGLP
jgi:tetratricopeptide (TPR) repeat protein